MAAIASALRLGQRATIRGRRFLNLHEYQSAQILRGRVTGLGIAATSVEECVKAAEQLKETRSSSIPDFAGGRFRNVHERQGAHVIPKSRPRICEKMIGQTLVTKQSAWRASPSIPY